MRLEPSNGLHSLGGILATVASGAAYGLCYPPTGLRALGWAVLVPFRVSIRRAGAGGALALAWLWTVVAAYAVGDWFPWSVSTYYQQPIAVGITFFVGVSSVMAAPYYCGFAAAYRAIARVPRPAAPLLVAAAWVAAEWSRANLLTGNPWALFGYSQSRVPLVAQVADVTGVYGLSFVLVAVGFRRAGLSLSIASCTVALVLGYGAARLRSIPSPDVEATGTATRIGVVQGNLDLGSQWRQDFYGRNLDVYMQLTLEVLRAERPAVVFWPESAMTFFLDDEPLYRAALGRLLAPYQAQLIAGAPRFTGARHDPDYYNTAFLLSPQGTILAWYDKRRLLPFAEYFPMRQLDFLRRRFARVREFTPGVSDALLPTPAGPAGVVICNEAVFPEIPAARVRAGAAYLVNLANDTWVSDAKFSAQLFDIVVLRAIEQRRYLVRASTAGYSAVVDQWGGVRAVTDPFTRSWIVGSVHALDTVTPYARVGDLFAYACIALWRGLGAVRLTATRRDG
jgi:apolipoprotein N-acyltransferase